MAACHFTLSRSTEIIVRPHLPVYLYCTDFGISFVLHLSIAVWETRQSREGEVWVNWSNNLHKNNWYQAAFRPLRLTWENRRASLSKRVLGKLMTLWLWNACTWFSLHCSGVEIISLMFKHLENIMHMMFKAIHWQEWDNFIWTSLDYCILHY